MGSQMRMGFSDRIVKLGEFFFRNRSWTPIPIILVLVFCAYKETSQDVLSWVVGLLLIFLGESIRIWGEAAVGKESRTCGGGVARLVTHGPYAHVRNPLYLGNFFLALGAVCISELLWMVPLGIVVFMAQYVPIVLWEERVLAERFPEEYAAYCQRVPRWWPCLRSQRFADSTKIDYPWRVIFRSERSTFWALAFLVLAMVAKEDLRHIPKYLHKHFMRSSRIHGLRLG